MPYRTLHRSGVAAFLLAVLAPVWAGEFGQEVEHVSPDRTLLARIQTDDNGESTVQIENRRSGAILLLRDDRSKNGDHGHAVIHSAWTPDSQFFVASLEPMADHPSWSHPIWVYSRDANHVVELWKLGLTVVANFQLRSPDILVTRVLAPRTNGRRAGQPLSVSLGSLLAKEKHSAE